MRLLSVVLSVVLRVRAILWGAEGVNEGIMPTQLFPQ